SDREYRLHSVAAGLLYTDILDSAILDWLSGFRELWAALLHLLAGRYEHAGVLGELVLQADRASTAAALGGDPQKVRTSPTHALHRQLLDGLRFLVREQLKLNRSEASDGWLTADSLWLVSKTVCDKLRAHLLSQGIDGIPSTNIAVFDVLQEHGIVQATPDGKAIWRATVTSGSGWTHRFTFLRIAPALIWDMNERPASFAGSVQVEDAVATYLSAGPATASASAEGSSAEVASATDMSTAPEEIASDSVDHMVASPSVHTEGVHAQTDRVATDTNPFHMPRPLPPPIETRSQHAPSTAPDEPIGLQFVSWL